MPSATPAHAPPLVLVTSGDPAGIGPEVVSLAWSRTESHAKARLRVVADGAVLEDVLSRRRGLPRMTLTPLSISDQRPSQPGELLVVEPLGTPMDPRAIVDGTITSAGGRSAASAVEYAATAVLQGLAAAIVTGPLHKEALHAAGYDVPGHTEFLARMCALRDDSVSMMLWLPAAGTRASLGVVHATLHEPMRTAIGRLSADLIAAAGQRLHDGLGTLLGCPPRIAVAALNPHGGEGGLFGDEERSLVAPAVARLRDSGVNAAGPFPADTLFQRAFRGEWDGVVALYHDQGHIPVKLVGMHEAVNVTLGLPIVRTSVAHGTAFDIVGTGTADPASMVAAIEAAIRLAVSRGVKASTAPESWCGAR